MGKSQIPIVNKNLKSFILKSQILCPNPNLRIQIPNQIQVFAQAHKHELRSVQQRRELAICQCQCYLIACLKCV